MSCPQGKKCKSKCGDKAKFNLSERGSNVCENFKFPTLLEEGRKCYKLDQHQWKCSNNHVVAGVEDGKKAPLVVNARKLLKIGHLRISLPD